jgi:hypothetical protein
MELAIVYNYIDHVWNCKFGTLQFLGHTIVCATNMQLNVNNMNMCHKNNGLI